ncbi:MAG: acyl-CoA synthetase [Gammaproteobacteria bacterium]|nr:acyl-CoA synthetase [Gammaproteobacteria bacterium]
MDFHFANAWELIADVVPDRLALICGEQQRTWREYEDRAARIAAVLGEHGLKPDSKIGLYLRNCNEYAEAHFGSFKMRGVPINVNYRYGVEELVYLFDNADAEAVVFEARYAPLMEAARRRLPKLSCLIQVADDSGEALLDGALDYEAAIAAAVPMPRIERPFDDIYMLYTGGTTGMPKGVMYHAGQFCVGMCAGFAMRGLEPPAKVEDIPELVKQVHAAGLAPTTLAASPQMHGVGMWIGTMVPHLMGGTVVTVRQSSLDPDAIWQAVAEHRVTDMTIIGDAFAKPLLQSLDGAREQGRPFDLTSLQQIVSSGVMWSAETKQRLLEHHDMMLLDAMGSSEGSMGMAMSNRTTPPQTARFALSPGVKVFTEDGREVAPGSEEIGLVATAGNVPIGYYKDPEKSARTFREVGGVRYSFPGDFAKVESDGTITLLGRGSQCINTGGEKVFPEEVEEAAKRHPDVADCLVVGMPDDRFGERVVAVLALETDADPGDEALRTFMRGYIAGYKLPRDIVRVPQVLRAANGKADYKWARATAEANLTRVVA